MNRIVTYTKEAVIQAAHFNDAKTYDNYFRALKERDFALLHDVLKDQHGHNFKVIIHATDVLDEKTLFVIDDEIVLKMINDWNNTNLTLHPDFMFELADKKRISLELMCVRLAEKIKEKTKIKTIEVLIYETETIYAKASIGL